MAAVNETKPLGAERPKKKNVCEKERQERKREKIKGKSRQNGCRGRSLRGISRHIAIEIKYNAG